MQLICLLQFRDERAELGDWLTNVTAHVDGIVALDDGSTDGGAELLAAHPKTREILVNPPDRPGWDEPGNHRRLVESALQHDADWLLCLDADDRLEREFRARVEHVLERRPDYRAAGLNYREVWGRRDQWRCDGIWGGKSRAGLFKRMDHYVFDERPLHALKAPLNALTDGIHPIVDADIYHLGMLTPERRAARRRRYETLDPDERYQPGIGYAYLTDETGLELCTIEPGREYWPA